jgi:hypothetical protein
MDLETTHILALVNGYNGRGELEQAAAMIQHLLINYAESNGEAFIIIESFKF